MYPVTGPQHLVKAEIPSSLAAKPANKAQTERSAFPQSNSVHHLLCFSLLQLQVAVRNKRDSQVHVGDPRSYPVPPISHFYFLVAALVYGGVDTSDPPAGPAGGTCQRSPPARPPAGLFNLYQSHLCTPVVLPCHWPLPRPPVDRKASHYGLPPSL